MAEAILFHENQGGEGQFQQCWCQVWRPVAGQARLSLTQGEEEREGKGLSVHRRAFTSALTLCSRNRLFFHRLSSVPGLLLTSVALSSWVSSRMGSQGRDLWRANATVLKVCLWPNDSGSFKGKVWSERRETVMCFLRPYYVPNRMLHQASTFTSDNSTWPWGSNLLAR